MKPNINKNYSTTLFALAVVAVFALISCEKDKKKNEQGVALALIAGNQSQIQNPCRAVLGETSAKLVWPEEDTARIAYVGMVSDNKGCESVTEEKKSLSYPTALTVDKTGLVYVSDRKGITVIDPANAKMTNLANQGDAKVTDAKGIAVASNGTIYISDGEKKAIQVFDKTGAFVKTLVSGLIRPEGIALDEARSRLYVADGLGHALRAYTLNGASVFSVVGNDSLPAESNLRIPVQIAVNSKGFIYVLNHGARKVHIYDTNGTFVRSFGTESNTSGSFIRPKGIAIDSEDHVYISDAAFDNFQIFDDQDRLLMWVGKAGSKPGEFNLPSTIAIDAQNRIYVAEFGAHRVQVFQYLGAK